MRGYDGFDETCAEQIIQIGEHDGHKFIAHTNALHPNLSTLTASSWNARALFHSWDVDKRTAKIAEADRIIKHSSFAGLQEMHSTDALMEAQFRRHNSSH